MTPRKRRREAEREERERKDVEVEKRRPEHRDEDPSPRGARFEVTNRLGARPEHDGDAEEKRQEPEEEHHVEEDRHDEETQSFVTPHRAKKRTQREARAPQVSAHEDEVCARNPENLRERTPELVIEDVLRLADGED